MTDLYTKIVLTVIAAALCVLVAQNFESPAQAVGTACGQDSWKPCHIVGEVRIRDRR